MEGTGAFPDQRLVGAGDGFDGLGPLAVPGDGPQLGGVDADHVRQCVSVTAVALRYRRLRHIRYADDHLLEFTGPRAEAEQIKQRLAAFLHDDLKLKLSREKTLITHARTGAARFLGYEITVQHNDTKQTERRRSVNGDIAPRVPKDVIKAKCSPSLSLAASPRSNRP